MFSKFKLRLVILFLLALSSTTILFAQEEYTGIQIPEGFNWLYLIFFAVGMVVHYAYKVYQLLGTANYLKNFLKNIFGWFFNKFHWTLLAGGAAAIIGLAAQYGLPTTFSTINLLGVGISLVGGYIGDMANQGTITKAT